MTRRRRGNPRSVIPPETVAPFTLCFVSTEWGRRRFLSTAFAGVAAFVAAGCSPSHAKRRATPRSVPVTSNGESFGGRIDAGSVDDLRRALALTPQPWYVPEARSYIVEFP